MGKYWGIFDLLVLERLSRLPIITIHIFNYFSYGKVTTSSMIKFIIYNFALHNESLKYADKIALTVK